MSGTDVASGPLQWKRKLSLIVTDAAGNALDLSLLRITFKVIQSEISTPNTAQIRVYNVAPQTSDKLISDFTRAKAARSELARVTLSAGYEDGQYGVIFNGEVKQYRRGRENATDTYFDIVAADADSAYNYSTISRTLAAGATARDIINAAAEAMAPFNVRLGPVPDNLATSPLPRARTLFGMTRDFLRQVCDLINCNWSIQNGTLTFTPRLGYVEGPVVVLTSASGLIGFPEQTQDGIQAQCLINPSIYVGRRVKLDNASVQTYRVGLPYLAEVQDNLVPPINNDGLYRVLVVDWLGDTHGQEWYANLILLSLDPAAVTPLSQANRGRDVQAGLQP